MRKTKTQAISIRNFSKVMKSSEASRLLRAFLGKFLEKVAAYVPGESGG